MKLWLLLFLLIPSLAGAEVSTANFKPYIFYPFERDSPKDHNYGAFHYTNIHLTVPADMAGRYYQSGLFHTWYHPNKVYGPKDYDRQRDGYHCMEGGVGYKPYLRFRSDATPHKFTTGAVAGGFGSFSNGPGQGVPGFNRSENAKALGWEKNVGRYGAAQINNRLLYPLDGIGFENGTNNQMLGYGYYALPLTTPKDSIAGSEAPAGNHCWTLFLNTANFSGPVCFFTPYHWAKHSIGKPHLHGRCFDNSLMKVNSTYQRETNSIPAKQWISPNGDIFYVITPYAMASDEDNIGRLGSMPMTIDGTKWNQLEKWFSGGATAPTSFGDIGKEIHLRKSNGVNLAFKINDIKVSTENFSEKVTDKDKSASALLWKGDLIKKFPNAGLIQIPQYYCLKEGSKKIVAIAQSEVPLESKLTSVNFPKDFKKDFQFDGFVTSPIRTPLHPKYKYRDEIIDTWKKPGPTAGPFTTKLTDGSQAVYYWYKFNEQPSILNSHMDAEERNLIQKRIELIHKEWTNDSQYFPDPQQKLVTLDKGLIVTPPKGLEIGYVPICVHQQQASEKLPRFKTIKRY